MLCPWYLLPLWIDGPAAGASGCHGCGPRYESRRRRSRPLCGLDSRPLRPGPEGIDGGAGSDVPTRGEVWEVVTPELFARSGDIISGAIERWKRPMTPHHVTPIGAARTMADSKSSIPPVHSRSSNGTRLYRKVCACGAVSIVDIRKLGIPCHPCAMKARRTHGLTTGHGTHEQWHPLYRLLSGIKSRCLYPSHRNYKYYGGRGISVCREWSDDPLVFVQWANANGWRHGLEIDRIDPNGNYCPENCRFLTHQENSQRTRRIKTTPQQAAQVKELFRAGASIKTAALAAGVTYMVAWHIKNSPGVWSNTR